MVPQAFQSFLAAFGLRSTRYVHVEPIGVEIANLRLRQGVTPPTVAVVTPPPVAPAGVPGPAGGTAATATGALQAQIDALKGQLSALGASGGGTAQIASSYARASAVGVEFNHIFDRPMAFGFEPVAFNLDWHKDDKHNVLVGSRMIPGDGKRGIARICDWAPPIR